MAAVVNGKRALSVQEKVKLILQGESGKKKDDLCREFGLENFTIQTIWKNRTKIISPFDQNASRILQFFFKV